MGHSELEYCLNGLKTSVKVLSAKFDSAMGKQAVEALSSSKQTTLKLSTVLAVDRLLEKKGGEAGVSAFRAKWKEIFPLYRPNE